MPPQAHTDPADSAKQVGFQSEKQPCPPEARPPWAPISQKRNLRLESVGALPEATLRPSQCLRRTAPCGPKLFPRAVWQVAVLGARTSGEDRTGNTQRR